MTAVAPVRNPFPGLRPFREDEEPLFFGREAHVDSMVDALGAHGFLAVVGSSGSGKSSLVSCGLIPALHRGLLARTGSGWRVATCRPGSQPMAALAEALAQPAVLPQPAEDETGFHPAELVAATLGMGKRGLLEAYREARPLLVDRPNLLVVVDQFEELFRYRALGGEASAAETATAFVNLLLEVAHQPRDAALPVFVVITMRSDFLGECAQFDGLPEAINRGQYLVPRMTREQRRAAIAGPVGVCGASIDPVLLTRLVNEVGDNPDQLSILQHALNRTWACWRDAGATGPLLADHYDAKGAMAGALDQHADEALAQLQPGRQQALCAALFRAITDRGSDARGTRRPTRLDTLCAITGASADELDAVMAPFRDPERAFLMPPHGVPLQPATVVDISHESLMRVWGALRGWVDEEAESARIYRRLAETAELHRDNQVLLLVPPELQLVTAWAARQQPNAAWAARIRPGFDAAMQFLQQSQAAHATALAAEQAREQAAREAEAERQRQALQAEAEAQQHELLKLLNKRWRLWVVPLALAAAGALYWQYQRVRAEADSARQQAALALEQAARIPQLEKALEAAQLQAAQREAAWRRQQAETAAARQSLQSERPQPVLYLQFADAGQRPEVERLRQALAQDDLRVPPAELVRQVPQRHQLRYFRAEDAALAQSLAARLAQLGLPGVQPVLAATDATVAQRQQVELWLARPDATAELARLVPDLDSPDKARRLAAGAALQNRWLAAPEAIAAVLGLFDAGRIETLGETGRLNALYFLSRTVLTAWTPDLAQRGRAAVARIAAREKAGVAVGAQTRAELDRLNAVLDAVQAGGKASASPQGR
ncbi:nSTAND1 domain-containing NTPase [Pseudaquabacterium pictum]|uniref:Novel STAND NTPase 1 domain-containing protein n=1 Tax=Pseudaquabacterium pictum TaxID=2315236 RepID=A0A480AXT0_9BURK|nr:hypothetical protein [Rubrivivax pictus]GCL66264.1 hypothetical protein AQPW35_53450 [Rubrivivax pictus]